jgi:hypothetical protein
VIVRVLKSEGLVGQSDAKRRKELEGVRKEDDGKRQRKDRRMKRYTRDWRGTEISPAHTVTILCTRSKIETDAGAWIALRRLQKKELKR